MSDRLIERLRETGLQVGMDAAAEMLRLRDKMVMANYLADNADANNAKLQATCDELAEALGVMTTLCRLKYGNLDADVYAEIQKAEAALARYRGEKE